MENISISNRAPADEISRFMDEFTGVNPHPPTTEWRFCGALGAGGKIYYDSYAWDKRHFVVRCYPEEETPMRLQMMKNANERLKKFNATF